MKEKLLKSMGFIIAIFDVAIYFLLSYIKVKGIQKNLITVLVSGALLFVGAIIANNAMTQQGLLKGEDNTKYQDTLKAHLTQKQKIYPKLNKLQTWLDLNYQKLLKIGRSVYVNSAGYEYEEVFTENGKIISDFKVEKPKARYFSEDMRTYREKKRFIHKAKHYKLSRLTVSDLMNVDGGKDPNDFGITEREYVVKQSGTSIISRFIFSCFLPCVSWTYLGFNMETLITQIINITLILVSAMFSMYCAYAFKVKTHRNTIICKINKLEEFDNDKEIEYVHTKKPLPTKSELVEEIHE